MRHELKTWPVFYAEVVAGRKTVEVRKNDRLPGFRVGDVLVLQEYTPSGDLFTGATCERVVTHIVAGGAWGLEPGYVAMSIADPSDTEAVAAGQRARIQSLCLSSIEVDRPRERGSDDWTDRHWLAQSILNILGGAIDDQIRAELQRKE